MRLIIAIATLVACSGAWAQEPPPESQGWKKLDFICRQLTTDYQYSEHFYVSEKEVDSWESFWSNGKTHDWHFSNQMTIQKAVYNSDGELSLVYDIDRATGRMSRTNVKMRAIDYFDCDLRPENKF